MQVSGRTIRLLCFKFDVEFGRKVFELIGHETREWLPRFGTEFC